VVVAVFSAIFFGTSFVSYEKLMADISSNELTNVFVFKDNGGLSQHLAKRIVQMSQDAIKSHGKFTIALSGGSLPTILAPGLIEQYKGSKDDSIQFSKWHVFFCR